MRQRDHSTNGKDLDSDSIETRAIITSKPEPLQPAIPKCPAIAAYGTNLLPMAFPEGSPNHTSYGSGHATVAGACVTMLKALFDDTQVIKNPVVPNPADGGQTLIPYVAPSGEPPLTVGGELNKVVSNVSQGRNMAGVHWRSDASQSNALGEAATISMLYDMKRTFSEPFAGFTFTKFDGTTISV